MQKAWLRSFQAKGLRQKAWLRPFWTKGPVRGSGKRPDLAPSGQKVPSEAQAKGLTSLLLYKRSSQRLRQKAWPCFFGTKGSVRGSGKRLDLAPSGQKVPSEAQAKGLTLLLWDKRSCQRFRQNAWPRSFGTERLIGGSGKRLGLAPQDKMFNSKPILIEVQANAWPRSFGT